MIGKKLFKCLVYVLLAIPLLLLCYMVFEDKSVALVVAAVIAYSLAKELRDEKKKN